MKEERQRQWSSAELMTSVPCNVKNEIQSDHSNKVKHCSRGTDDRYSEGREEMHERHNFVKTGAN